MPQSFMVALMGSLAPMLIMRAKFRLRAVGVGRVLFRALGTALIAALFSSGGTALLASVARSQSLHPLLALSLTRGVRRVPLGDRYAAFAAVATT